MTWQESLLSGTVEVLTKDIRVNLQEIQVLNSELAEGLKNLSQTSTSNSAATIELAKKVSELYEKMRDKFEAIGERVSKAETRIDGIEEYIDQSVENALLKHMLLHRSENDSNRPVLSGNSE